MNPTGRIVRRSSRMAAALVDAAHPSLSPFGLEPRTTDGDLIVKVGRGDRAAFEELYRRFARPVLGLAVRLLGDHGRAEDAAQDTFAAIWRSAKSYKPERGTGSAWLFAVARHAIIDRARQRTELTIAEPIEQVATDAIPVESAEQSWLSFTVQAAMERLPERERQVLELAYWSGLSQSEVASYLDVPLGTVKTRTRAGLGRLAAAARRGAPMTGPGRSARSPRRGRPRRGTGASEARARGAGGYPRPAGDPRLSDRRRSRRARQGAYDAPAPAHPRRACDRRLHRGGRVRHRLLGRRQGAVTAHDRADHAQRNRSRATEREDGDQRPPDRCRRQLADGGECERASRAPRRRLLRGLAHAGRTSWPSRAGGSSWVPTAPPRMSG